jgi:hypothetical protein
MAALRTSEECAKSLLAVFRVFNARAGQALPAGQLETAFHSEGGGGADYQAAVLCAVERRWIKIDYDAVRLTEDGSTVMSPSSKKTTSGRVSTIDIAARRRL